MIDYYKLEHEHEFAKNTVVINWCLLNICNYKCSYCPEYLHSGSSGWPDLHKVEQFCSNVIEHYEGKNIYFEFTGGEITYWKDFQFLVDYLKSHRDVYVGVISNGSQKLDWWRQMRFPLDHACLSFQPEFSKREHYIDLAKMINKYLRTHINLMLQPDYFDLCLDVVEEIVTDVPNVSIALQPLSIGFKDKLYKYNEKQLEIIDRQFELYGSRVKWDTEWPIFRGAMKTIGEQEMSSSAHRFISENTNHWKGWLCHAGVEQIVIDANGQIWRGWCLEGGTLGYIDDDYVTLPDKPIICKRDYCHCNFDIMCTKEKI